MSAVDLSSGLYGVVVLEDGARFWCPLIERHEADEFKVRVESGWYNRFTKDGRAISAGRIIKANGSEENVAGRSIVEFIPCDYDDPRANGLPTSTCP